MPASARELGSHFEDRGGEVGWGWEVGIGFQTQEAEAKEITFIPSVQAFSDYKNSFLSSEQQFSLSFPLFEDTS